MLALPRKMGAPCLAFETWESTRRRRPAPPNASPRIARLHPGYLARGHSTPCQPAMPRFASQLASNVEVNNPIRLPIVSLPGTILISGSIPAAARRALSHLFSRPSDLTFLKTKDLARKSASILLKTMVLRTWSSPPGG